MTQTTTHERAIAERIGAEDAVLLATGGLGLVAGLHACSGTTGRVAIQRGHAVDIGGSPVELIEWARLAAVEIGLVDRCHGDDLDRVLPSIDLGLFVDDPRTVGRDLIDLPRFLWQCHAAGCPVVVHERSPPSWERLFDAGADLASIDLGETLGRPGGLVAGNAARVARVRRTRTSLPALYGPPADVAETLLVFLRG